MKLIAKLRRDKRGLSPIFAVLILIAIAVIAAIVVYMFTSGYLGSMMGGGTTGQEKVAVESVQWDNVSGTVTVWAKSVGGGNVVIDSVIIRDSSGNQVGDAVTGLTYTLDSDGTLTKVGPITPLFPLSTGETHTVAIVSTEGGQFLSSSFTT